MLGSNLGYANNFRVCKCNHRKESYFEDDVSTAQILGCKNLMLAWVSLYPTNKERRYWGFRCDDDWWGETLCFSRDQEVKIRWTYTQLLSCLSDTYFHTYWVPQTLTYSVPYVWESEWYWPAWPNWGGSLALSSQSLISHLRLKLSNCFHLYHPPCCPWLLYPPCLFWPPTE